MTHGDRSRASCASASASRTYAEDGAWGGQCRGEPELDEILDDPIMTLLWRGDRLEPDHARATVMALRERVRGRRREGVLASCMAA
jgi:hypothetical protein